MQFYFIFPAIMLTICRIGPIKSSLAFIAGCVILQGLFPDFFHHFSMPAFLPMKLYVFFIGIWIAVARTQKSMRWGFFISLSITAIWVIFERSLLSITRIFLGAVMFYLLDNGTLPANQFLRNKISTIREFLSCPVNKFLGDTSYATYLLHLMIVLPVAGELVHISKYQLLNPALRFGICLLISMPIIYLLSWLLYNLVEKSGIQAGKMVVRAIKDNFI
jgi:peptidoglycan/LPS O-acetylase OafA/YrhL